MTNVMFTYLKSFNFKFMIELFDKDVTHYIQIPGFQIPGIQTGWPVRWIVIARRHRQATARKHIIFGTRGIQSHKAAGKHYVNTKAKRRICAGLVAGCCLPETALRTASSQLRISKLKHGVPSYLGFRRSSMCANDSVLF